MSNKLIFAFLLWFCACNPDRNKEIDPDNPDFSTSDQSELFFKNVRKSYYDLEVHQASKMEIYRIKQRAEMSLVPMIVNNWLKDEAYIMFELKNDLSEIETLQIVWADTTGENSGSYKYVLSGREATFKFSTQIYKSIQRGDRLKCLIADNEVPFLENYEEREAYRITMFDYYKLVDLIY